MILMSQYNKHILLLFVLLCAALCFGCARKDNSVPAEEVMLELDAEQGDEMDMLLDDDFFGDDSVAEKIYADPLEPLNRIFFEFNDKLYSWVISPVNTVYSTVLPWDIRFSIGNFINNLAAPIRLINNLLQWKIQDAGIVLSRFLINSTLGVYGFGDPAWLEFDLEPKPEDFGQTLGSWGIGEGVYLCLPVIGPSSVRDAFGFTADVYTHPMVYFVDDIWVSAGYYSVTRVNALSLNPEAYEDLKKYSIDPYISMRQVYLDYRRSKVEDQTLLLHKNDNELSP